jgi:hypothetical protein
MVRSSGVFALALVTVACGPTEPSALCRARPPFTPATDADAVPVLLRFDNQMGVRFRADSLCITIDDQTVPFTGPQEEEAMAAFEHHKLLEVRAPLRAGVPHKVHVFATFRGVGTELEGFKFDLHSEHLLDGEALRPGVLRCNFTERPEAELARRPGVTWVDPNVPGQ